MLLGGFSLPHLLLPFRLFITPSALSFILPLAASCVQQVVVIHLCHPVTTEPHMDFCQIAFAT